VQAVQAFAAVDEYEPTAQETHDVALTEALIEPAAHGYEAMDEHQLPATQAVQAIAAVEEYEPAAHKLQEGSEHTVKRTRRAWSHSS